VAVSLLAAGCGGLSVGGGEGDFVKPTIAVATFENRAPFPMGWRLGDGMRDVLVDRLLATGRFQVVERPEIDTVLREIQFQHSGATRANLRAAQGRLKNVQYLVKGTITDFGHVSTDSGFLSITSWDIFGRTSRAVVGMVLYVIDVESGEIICSRSLEESVRTRDASVQAVYKDVAFGGTVFYRTPLGRATRNIIDQAVDHVAESIAVRPWEPKIALVQPGGRILINGGKDRGVECGMRFEVVDAGQPVVDPDTGDVIGHHSVRTIGQVRVCEVHDRYSAAQVLEGRAAEFQAGQRCRRTHALAGTN